MREWERKRDFVRWSLCPGGPAVEIDLFFFCYSADHFYIYNFVADVLGGLPHLSGLSLKMTEGERKAERKVVVQKSIKAKENNFIWPVFHCGYLLNEKQYTWISVHQ